MSFLTDKKRSSRNLCNYLELENKRHFVEFLGDAFRRQVLHSEDPIFARHCDTYSFDVSRL